MAADQPCWKSWDTYFHFFVCVLAFLSSISQREYKHSNEFCTFLLNTDSVPVTILGIMDSVVNKTVLFLWRFHFHEDNIQIIEQDNFRQWYHYRDNKIE